MNSGDIEAFRRVLIQNGEEKMLKVTNWMLKKNKEL